MASTCRVGGTLDFRFQARQGSGREIVRLAKRSDRAFRANLEWGLMSIFRRVPEKRRFSTMRALALPLISSVVLVAAAPVARAAGNPRFQSAVANIDPRTGALDVAFSEVGVVHRSKAFVTLQTGNNPGFPGTGAMAIERCYLGAIATTNYWYPVSRPSSRIPAPVGSRGVASVAAPRSGSFTCPPGQTLFLDRVTYLGVSLSGSAGETLQVVPGYVSAALHVSLARSSSTRS